MLSQVVLPPLSVDNILAVLSNATVFQVTPAYSATSHVTLTTSTLSSSPESFYALARPRIPLRYVPRYRASLRCVHHSLHRVRHCTDTCAAAARVCSTTSFKSSTQPLSRFHAPPPLPLHVHPLASCPLNPPVSLPPPPPHTFFFFFHLYLFILLLRFFWPTHALVVRGIVT